MSPLDFLQRPALWLETISRYHATTSGGPSFGYELCIRRLSAEQRERLDLSSWKVAFNGAEPVRADVIDKFSETFAPQGFRKEAFFPCYGLAEATLLVTGGAHAKEPVTITVARSELESRVVVLREAGEAGARPLVACGHAWLEQKLLIVDPDSCLVCPADRVGEIWISGSSVTNSYWNDPERNAHTFQGYLADTNEGPFLRTGDLGFVRDGELFVTGRLKDVVIIRGRNHYPEDIEQTVERSNPFLRPGCGAAFSIDVEGTEQLVIVHEVTRDALKGADLSVVVDDVREAVTANHGLRPYAVSLVLPGRIPKTSSGKIRRKACCAQYLDQSLELAETWSQRAHVAVGRASAEDSV
jgi:acyl-CoA synthetase (AMP-forming)/AMP-acid ligase II